MDERVKLQRNMQGGTEIRVKRSVVDDEGPEWFYSEIEARGLKASDLGRPFDRGSTVIIPIRKEKP